MATVLVPLVRNGNVEVALAYDDVTLDVLGFRLRNPDGRPARFRVRNTLTDATRVRVIPQTAPGGSVMEPAPSALTMVRVRNYHGVEVVALPPEVIVDVQVR